MTYSEYYAAVRAREEAATKGPWKAYRDGLVIKGWDSKYPVVTTADTLQDSTFIAAARTDVRVLRERCEVLEKMLLKVCGPKRDLDELMLFMIEARDVLSTPPPPEVK